MTTTNKEQRLVVRLTEAEKKALQEFAAKHQTTISDVIRHNLFEYGETIIRVNVKPEPTQ